MEESAVTFEAILGKVMTTVDGGARVSLDLPEEEVRALSDIAALRGMVLQVALVPKG